MSGLSLVWITALVLVAAALLWMAVLIALRLRSARRNEAQATERRSIMDALLRLLRGEAVATTRLAPFVSRPRLMGEILVEIRGLVRGDDHDRLRETLRGLDLPEALARVAARGSKAARIASLEALSAIGGAAAEASLRAALVQGDPEVRLTALKGLVDAGNPIDLGHVLADLAGGAFGRSRVVVEVVREAIARTPEPALAALARADLDGFTRALLIDGLGAAGEYRAIADLIAAAEDPDPEVRAAVARAAGRLMHPAMQPALGVLLKDPAWHVRASAAEGIGMANLAILAEPVADLLGDREWWVRFRAGEALRRLGASGAAQLRRVSAGGDSLARHTAELALAEAA